MEARAGDEEFEYDKPGAERSRRRRGGGDDVDSDLEGDLLEEDWISYKKNPSDLSDEELNDDLLQSDEEDQNTSAQGEEVSLNATSGLQEGAAEGEQEEYGEEEGLECSAGGNEDVVLDLQIIEPDDEFKVDDYSTEPEEVQPDQQMTEGEGAEPEEEAEDVSQVTEADEAEPDSDEDEEDDEESERLRFKTERKDRTVVRLSDRASKRRNIPETLELTEEAKADLLQFEEKERLRKQGRFGGRGRGGVGRGRGGGPPVFGMGGFRKDGGGGRGRMNEPRPPLMSTNPGIEALDLIFEPAEDEREMARSAEEEEDDDVSEEENFVPSNEESRDEEMPPGTEDLFQSKARNILWSSIPPSSQHHILRRCI